MLFLTIVLSVLALSVSQLTAQTCTNQTDIDYFGNDITFAYLPSVADCCNFCYGNTQCARYTYIAAVKGCWLKTNSGLAGTAADGRKNTLKYFFSYLLNFFNI